VPTTAQVDLRSNLLANGNAEQPDAKLLGKDRGARYHALPGWKGGDDGMVSQAGEWNKITALAGLRFMRAAQATGGVSRQDVTLNRNPAKRPRHLLCSALMRSGNGRDQVELSLSLLDAERNSLFEQTTGKKVNRQWRVHQVIAPVVAGAVTARVTLRVINRSGSVCTAAIDDVSLEAIGDGFPATLAGSPAKDLIDELGETPEADRARRRGLMSALIGMGTDEVVHHLEAELELTKATNEREQLIEFLALTQNPRTAARFKDLLVSKDARARRHSLQLAQFLAFDWRNHLASSVSATDNANLRAAWLRTLADGSKSSVKHLATIYRAGDTARKLEVLEAIRGPYDAAAVMTPFIKPHCQRKVNRTLRHKAMQHLAESKHPGYLSTLSQVYDDEGDGSRRSSWILWCGNFDNLDAVGLMMSLVIGQDTAREGPFISAIQMMKSKKVGSHVRNRWVKSDEPALRRAAVALMTETPWPGDLAELRDLCSDPDEEVALAALHGLASTNQPRASAQIARFLDRDANRRSPRVVAAAMRALWRADEGSDATVARAMEAAVDGLEWQLRATAIRLLAPKHAGRARAVFLRALDDDKRQVRIAAYEALTWVRKPETVTRLFDALEEEDDYVSHFIGDNLANLTGVHLGIDPQTWRTWWGVVESDFECPDRPSNDKRPTPASGTMTTYYNIPLRANRIAFLIDLSGSMGGKVKGVTKLKAAKTELIRVLEQLSPKHHFFNIIGFGDRPIPYAPDLQRATKTEIRAAIKYVNRLRVGGATNIYDSLEMAMDMSELESIFLLTDGAPSAGAYTRTGDILEVMRRNNSYLRIRINTISIGGGNSGESFMKRLATQNWGSSINQ